jgi:hypothetical protein
MQKGLVSAPGLCGAGNLFPKGEILRNWCGGPPGGARWARRPPGRLPWVGQCLILREKSGTRASGPEGHSDQGGRPIGAKIRHAKNAGATMHSGGVDPVSTRRGSAAPMLAPMGVRRTVYADVRWWENPRFRVAESCRHPISVSVSKVEVEAPYAAPVHGVRRGAKTRALSAALTPLQAIGTFTTSTRLGPFPTFTRAASRCV